MRCCATLGLLLKPDLIGMLEYKKAPFGAFFVSQISLALWYDLC